MLLRIINLPVFDDHSTISRTTHDRLWSAMRLHFPLTKTSFLYSTFVPGQMRDNSIFAEQFLSRLIVSSETCSRTSFDISGFLKKLFKKKKKMKSRFSKYFSRKKPKDIEKSTQLRLKYSCTTLTKHSLERFLDPILLWERINRCVIHFRNDFENIRRTNHFIERYIIVPLHKHSEEVGTRETFSVNIVCQSWTGEIEWKYSAWFEGIEFCELMPITTDKAAS